MTVVQDTCIRVAPEEYVCDKCKRSRGEWFIQGAWLCGICRARYLDLLDSERYKGVRCR